MAFRGQLSVVIRDFLHPRANYNISLGYKTTFVISARVGEEPSPELLYHMYIFSPSLRNNVEMLW